MDTATNSWHAPARMNPVKNYFQNLRAILTHPTDFFRNLDLNGSLVSPLVFAVITHWLGSALAYLWQNAIGQAFKAPFGDIWGAFDQFVQIDSTDRSLLYTEMRHKFMDWMWGVGSILIDPFKTILSILLTSFFVWLGAKLLVNPEVPDAKKRLSYETAVTIVAFGFAPSILQGIPVLGSVVAWIFIFAVTVIGAREVYRVGAGRGMVIVLFPKLLLISFFVGSFALLALLFVKLFFAAVAL